MKRYWMKGATAYEYQVGKWCLRIVHLTGGYFKWYTPWRRFSLKYYEND